MENRLHGDWHRTGAGRWCKDCRKWVRLADWEEHKQHGTYRLSDEILDEHK